MKNFLSFAAALVCTLVVVVALGHSGAPSLTTFGTGQTLTSQALNDSFSHLHNTLTGGIANVNISATAGISHSKLAVPALVPKAWAYVSGCNCGAADGTTCGSAVKASSRVTSVKATGTNGVCKVELAYTPTDAFFAVTSVSNEGTAFASMRVNNFATSNPHFKVAEVDAANAGIAASNSFSFVVYDNDN